MVRRAFVAQGPVGHHQARQAKQVGHRPRWTVADDMPATARNQLLGNQDGERSAHRAGNQSHLNSVVAQAQQLRVKTRPGLAGSSVETLLCDSRQFAVEVEHTASRYCSLLSAHHDCRPLEQVLRAEDGRLAGRMVQDWEVSVYHGFSHWNVVDETLLAIFCPGSKLVLYQSPTEFADDVDKQVKIGTLAAMVRDGNTDREATLDACARSHGGATVLELTQYLVIQCVERLLVVFCGTEPEANDVERDWSQTLHAWRFFN
jgi:hypothetical protein